MLCSCRMPAGLWTASTEARIVLCSDMSTFFDDIKTVRPTSLMLIPRIANMIYDQAQEKLRKAGDSDKQVRNNMVTCLCIPEDCFGHILGSTAHLCTTNSQRRQASRLLCTLLAIVSIRRVGQWLQHAPCYLLEPFLASRVSMPCLQAVIEDFRDHELGGRVFSALTGSAPTAPEVVDFLRDSLIVPIYEGYGSTEAGMISYTAVVCHVVLCVEAGKDECRARYTSRSC